MLLQDLVKTIVGALQSFARLDSVEVGGPGERGPRRLRKRSRHFVIHMLHENSWDIRNRAFSAELRTNGVGAIRQLQGWDTCSAERLAPTAGRFFVTSL
jgi:hypothetical protein